MAEDPDLKSTLYQPLPPGPYMRTLSLDRTSLTGERRYSLQCRRIDADDSSLALSYRWQKSETQPTILVNGRRFSVMQNVRDFLDIHFANQNCNEIFIDSICINQRDLEERASQVGLMGQINTCAAKVCIWLGRGISAKQHDVLFKALEWKKDDIMPQEDRYRFVGEVFIEEYWKRAWVIQEVVLARKLELYWDEIAVPEAVLHRAGDTDDLMLLRPEIRAAAEVLQQSLRSSKATLANSLAQLLCAYKHTQATDVRDKVYAMLSLARDRTTKTALAVDYSHSKSLVDVFCDVMDHCDIKPGMCFYIAATIAQSLGIDCKAMQASPRALRQTMCVRGWIVGMIHGPLKTDDDLDDPERRGRMFSPGTPCLRRLGPDVRMAAMTEGSHEQSCTKMQDGTIVFPAVQTHRVRHSPTATRFYSSTDLTDVSRKRPRMLSQEPLEPGDTIVNFGWLTALLVLRKVHEHTYIAIGSMQCEMGWRAKVEPRIPTTKPTWDFVDAEPDARGLAPVRFCMNLLAIIEIATGTHGQP